MSENRHLFFALGINLERGYPVSALLTLPGIPSVLQYSGILQQESVGEDLREWFLALLVDESKQPSEIMMNQLQLNLDLYD